MPVVHFTSNLLRHLPVAQLEVAGESVAAVLAAVFIRFPGLKTYLLDDQGGLRQHVVVFVDGQQVRDRQRQSDAVGSSSEIHVMQALSGG